MKVWHSLTLSFLLLTVIGCGRIDLTEDEKPTPETENTDSTETADYISVEDALAVDVDEYAYVRGYIVGYVNGTSLSKAVFTCPDETANTNMLLADNAHETDPNKCIPILLSTQGTPSPRSVLNLYDNPENLHRCIRIGGYIETYFKVNGIRDILHYEWDSDSDCSGYPLPVIDPTLQLIPEGR